MSGSPVFDWSTPAFAHTNPWRVRQIRRPRSARRSSVVSSRMAWTWRGSLSCSAASSRARSEGSMSASRRTRPSAFETTLWAMTRMSSGPSSTRSRSSAARSSPGRTSGMPGSGSSLTRRARAARAARGSAARRRARPRARRAGRRGRRGCRRRARATAAARPGRSRRAAWASAAWRAKEPGPKAGVSTAGRIEQERVGARAVAVGHDDARRPRPRPAARRPRPDPARGSRRARAGPAAPRAPPPSARRATPPRTGPTSSGSCTHSMPAVRLAALRRAHHDDPIQPPHRAQRLEHVPDHRRGQLGAIHPGGPQPLLRAPERLDGEDGDRTHGARDYPRSAAANTSVSSATRRRASASPISTSVSSVGTPLARSSLTSPSIRPS